MSNAWIGFLGVFLLLLVLAIMQVIGKLPKFKTKDKTTKVTWRAQPGSMASVTGQAVSLLVIIVVVAFLTNKDIALKMVSNPFFWAYPCLALVFYVFFPMGNIIPVSFFKAVNTVIMIGLVPIIIYTTFFRSSDNEKKDPEKISQQQIKHIFLKFEVGSDDEESGGWTELDLVPLAGEKFQIEPFDGLKWKIGKYDGTEIDLEKAHGSIVVSKNDFYEKTRIYSPDKRRITIRKILN